MRPIIGGAGSIGSNLDRLAVESGHDITVLDDFTAGYRSKLDGTDVRLVEGASADRDAVDAATDGADAVVHLGALGSVPRSIPDPMSTHLVNPTGTLTLLWSVRAAKVGVAGADLGPVLIVIPMSA